MTLTDVRTDTRPYVDATIRFTDPASAGSTLEVTDHESSTFQLIPKTMRIRNARAEAGRLSFDANGFTMVRAPFEIDWADQAQVRARYYPEAARIVRELTGAKDVLVFLDLIRSSKRDEGIEPANNAHIDFDEPSIQAWVRWLRPDDAETLVGKRLVNINLWRPIRPIECMPLAVCDASSVGRGELVPTKISGRPGEAPQDLAGFNLAYDPDQRWFWHPDMQPDEVLAFKIFDSDQARPHLCAHTAFVDPASHADAPPRMSIEVRTIAILD
jgi:hypothetical protein